MTDVKPLASLSGGLLARKGGARPAMRPQFQRIEAAAADTPPLDDLGWDDMGDDVREAADILPLTPAPRGEDESARIRAADAAAALALAANARSYTADGQAAPADPATPEVHRQQAQLTSALAASDAPKDAPTDDGDTADAAVASAPAPAVDEPARPGRAPRPRSALERGGRAAFTLRLDGERHLRLRLAATIRNQSAQAIVTDALDALLGTMPELEPLAAQVERP